ncbi:type II restriction endonuclease [Bradyrhizobium sediminis]|uniref:Type II restriction endonuclease n=1 Tax=Bradyrhizobium sediminis TaxID=2840469 RepID=A0A975NYU1_9BRAD|nr:type II restriction endonuclease [Bradyrhizobium sediminis]QWG23797.1 type II restriction endonuclease [Bradyrhizobium sediminis]
MRRGLLSDYFEWAAVKRLSAVEADPERSHQHEFAGGHLRKMFGDEDRLEFPARFIWLSDEQEGISEDGKLSWYDSRRKNPDRSAEYRLYYFDNGVTSLMKEGDSFFVAARRDGSTMVIITPEGSTIESQLAWLFGIEGNGESFESTEITEDESFRLDFAARYILDEIGIDAEEPETDVLDTILEKCGNKFPATHDFSKMARESLPEVSAMDDADHILMTWLEREELLFRRMERHIVSERLKTGFVAADTADVDGFIAFSLSVQNRRKSRAGYSLEHHLTALFKARGIKFERGVETENRNKPDFLFPGQNEYRDAAFDTAKLTMLGAKSTCKDRWRQVLSEATRIQHKHLVTLEPGITENQTDEMKAKHLQLVVPVAIHDTYKPSQQEWLMGVADFVELVKSRQVGDS